MSDRFVLFGIPSFRGEPVREYHVSMSETQTLLTQAGIRYSMTMLAGDPYLSKCRNRILSSFLTDFPQATDLFFLDDDIGWPAEAVLRLLDLPHDVVCGVYPKKQDSLSFPVTLELDANGDVIRDGNLVSGALIPTGFLRIKRRALEKLAMVSPKYEETDAFGKTLVQWSFVEAKYVDPDMEALKDTDLSQLSREDAIAHLRRALGLTIHPGIGQWWGEDYWFSHRWRAMGGKVWVDPEIAFTHRGSKAWAATFGDSVRATVEARKADAAKTKVPGRTADGPGGAGDHSDAGVADAGQGACDGPSSRVDGDG